MEQSKRVKLKKYLALLTISVLIAVSIFFILGNKDSFSIFDADGKFNLGKKSPAQTDSPAPAPTCDDGIQNQGEGGVDCGGPCPEACPPSCHDGILNQDEEKTDCGGTICAACPTCTDGIQNQGERRVDCGGPCEPCPPDCYDGIQNQDETGVDCGGTICAACPTCDDGILNQGECQIDCGGPCPACPLITALTADEVSKVKNAILSSEFVSALPNDGVISLHFFNYQCGQRVELDTFLIGKDQILTSGTPDIEAIMHSKYIAEISTTDLCDIIIKADTNGDMAFGSELSDSKLLFKYSGMVKYRDCFGF